MAYVGSEVSSANRYQNAIKNSESISTQGTNYESWRVKLLTKISSKGAKPVTMENPMEPHYRLAPKFYQMTNFPEYDIMQDKAKNVLFKRLSQQDMDKVQHLPSFLTMLEVLDSRYGIRTHVGAVAARTRLNRLFYQTNKDFEKFLSLFEIRLEEAIQAGNNFTEYDKMFQLAQALGEGYADILSGMGNLRPEFQNLCWYNWPLPIVKDMPVLPISAFCDLMASTVDSMPDLPRTELFTKILMLSKKYKNPEQEITDQDAETDIDYFADMFHKK